MFIIYLSIEFSDFISSERCLLEIGALFKKFNRNLINALELFKNDFETLMKISKIISTSAGLKRKIIGIYCNCLLWHLVIRQ